MVDTKEIKIGDVIQLQHQKTKRLLRSLSQNYSHSGASRQQMVVATDRDTPETYWIVKAANAQDATVGGPVEDGQIIRLEHWATRRNLHSHSSPAPFAPSQKEITAYQQPDAPLGQGDGNDNWIVEKIDSTNPNWRLGDVLRLVHEETPRVALHSHDTYYFPDGEQEVTGVLEKNEDDLWLATEIIPLDPEALARRLFDSLQVSVNHSLRHGFSVLASYVWANYLDVVSYTAEGGNGPRDPSDFRRSYGPSDNNVRHRFAASYIYQLPKVSSLHGISGALVNDWQNQSIITMQTGSPYSINSSEDTAATGIGGETADLTGASLSPGNRGVQAYFNPLAFQNAAAGTFGQTGRNFLTGPSLVNVDFSLFKEFPVFDRGKVEFRGELFNLFNHPNFYNPDNTVGDGTFGQILSARDPRIAQFALKYMF